MSKRAAINLTTKLAAALRLKRELEDREEIALLLFALSPFRERAEIMAVVDKILAPAISYDHAKGMHAEQLASLFQFDHGILHGIVVNDHHSNLTPIFAAPHREKSKTDTGIVAKAVRIDKGTGAYVRALQAGGSDKPVIPRKKTAGRIKGRSSFPPGRKLQSRNTFRR